MDKVNLQFLGILKEALDRGEFDLGEMSAEEMVKLYDISNIHHVIPMVYNVAYKKEAFKEMEPGLKSRFKFSAINFVSRQIQRSARFLELYRKLQEKNLKILVFKGIIFRNMYNTPDNRISADEDILVKPEDYDMVKEFFLSEGLEFIDKSSDNECAFFCKISGLCIEMSKSLFDEEAKAYGHLNYLFEDIFEKSITINIEGVDIMTMSHQQHLIYIVFHNMKHFLTGGFGIRQVADFGMYIMRYGEFIDWNSFWKELKHLNYDIFTLNLIDICKTYLGLDDDKVSYKYFDKRILDEDKDKFAKLKASSKLYINSKDLLDDILDAGVFGASTMDRKHTALMTLDAADKTENNNRLKAIFPNVKYLENKYVYLKKYPILLPVAWVQRIFSYMKEGNNATASYINTMNLGKQRIELLRQYKIIK